MSIQILVVHKNSFVRELLVAALKRQSRFQVIGSGANASDYVPILSSSTADIALVGLDGDDATTDGLLSLQRVRQNSPLMRCVLVVERPDPNLVVPAFRAGARGIFCASQFSLKLLLKCISCVHAGQIWATSADLNQLLDALTQLPLHSTEDSQPAPAGGNRSVQGQTDACQDCGLTRREQDVLRLLAEGMTNREIAQELGVSMHTVKNHLFHIFDKAGVSTRVELVLYAMNRRPRHLQRNGLDQNASRSSNRPALVPPAATADAQLRPVALVSEREAVTEKAMFMSVSSNEGQ